MMYKVKAYTGTKENHLSWTYAVDAPNEWDARQAVKRHLRILGFHVYRSYATTHEIDGYINWYEENLK